MSVVQGHVSRRVGEIGAMQIGILRSCDTPIEHHDESAVLRSEIRTVASPGRQIRQFLARRPAPAPATGVGRRVEDEPSSSTTRTTLATSPDGGADPALRRLLSPSHLNRPSAPAPWWAAVGPVHRRRTNLRDPNNSSRVRRCQHCVGTWGSRVQPLPQPLSLRS